MIGVVSDFHYGNLRRKIGPIAMIFRPRQFGHLGVRIRADNHKETIAFFKETWRKFTPEGQRFQYRFWDQDFELIYEEERRVQSLTLLASGVAILLACMGLFALASYAAEERRKEIGVRKTLGATVSSLVTLVSREFVLVVLIAAVVSSPIAWILTRGWLDNFAYRTELGVGIFVLAGFVAMVIAQLTVAYHAFRAAQTDPVLALRDE